MSNALDKEALLKLYGRAWEKLSDATRQTLVDFGVANSEETARIGRTTVEGKIQIVWVCGGAQGVKVLEGKVLEAYHEFRLVVSEFMAATLTKRGNPH